LDGICQVRKGCPARPRPEILTSPSFQHTSSITSCRETLLSSLSKNKNLQYILKTTLRDSRALEINALLSSSKLSRHHGALQNSLATATYLNRLIKPCEEIGLNIAAAVQFESANVLWDQGELTASIRMLQDLQNKLDADSQLIHVGKPELLAKLVGKLLCPVTFIV
jgi:ataxia telangiectasia mutated family protein